MYFSFFGFSGYGFFILFAFIFTFLCCAYLFLKTKGELEKQEKLFSEELKVLQAEKVAIATRDRKVKKIYQLS